MPLAAMLIKDLPEDERPREKLDAKGAESLADAELLALVFGSGTKGRSAIQMGREMLRQFGSLRNLSRASVKQLQSISGVGPAKASHLAAIFELGRRLAREPFAMQAVASPEDVYELVGPEMQRLAQESVRAILLNHKRKLIYVSEVFRGTDNECFANPAQILREAITRGAHSLILVHNHPSGDPSPSQADREVTKRMQTASTAVGLEFTDHIIIGCISDAAAHPYFSFREAGLL